MLPVVAAVATGTTPAGAVQISRRTVPWLYPTSGANYIIFSDLVAGVAPSGLCWGGEVGGGRWRWQGAIACSGQLKPALASYTYIV